MSAYIGICLEDGAFLAADTRRTDVDTDTPWKQVIKKIYQLNPYTIIATGGLGTFGHQAREEMQDYISSETMELTRLIEIAQKIFSNKYAYSFKEYPNHSTPLTAIIAGKDIVTNKGYICSLSSMNNFKPFLITQKGQPYFAGSNTQLVQEIASEKYFKYNKNEFPLDRWALSSLEQISNLDNHVGFPIQYIKITNKCYERFPVNKLTFKIRKEFTVSL